MTHHETRTKESFDGWLTPEWVLDLVRAHAHGPIALDPCTEPSNPTKARVYYTDGALEYPWNPHARGPVYVNPPYGRQLSKWANTIADESSRLYNDFFVLVPARPDTKWFQTLAARAHRIALFSKRIKFHHPSRPGARSPGFPSAMIYIGSNRGRFDEVFAPVALVVTPMGVS